MTKHTKPFFNYDYFFVFDVESLGLYGEAFAVAGGCYDRNGDIALSFVSVALETSAKALTRIGNGLKRMFLKWRSRTTTHRT